MTKYLWELPKRTQAQIRRAIKLLNQGPNGAAIVALEGSQNLSELCANWCLVEIKYRRWGFQKLPAKATPTQAALWLAEFYPIDQDLTARSIRRLCGPTFPAHMNLERAWGLRACLPDGSLHQAVEKYIATYVRMAINTSRTRTGTQQS